jgi:hypothetical protein
VWHDIGCGRYVDSDGKNGSDFGKSDYDLSWHSPEGTEVTH